MKIEHVENNCLQIFIRRCLSWLCCTKKDSDNTATNNIVVKTARPRGKSFIQSLESKQMIYEQLCEVNDGSWSHEDIQEAVSSCSDYICAFHYLTQERPVGNDQTQSSQSQEIKREIYEQLCKMNKGSWSQEDIEEAVSSCPDYNSALQYLTHECPLCCDQYPFSKFVKMTHCNCSLCEQCFVRHFSSVIKEKSIIHVVCPICKKPELEKNGNSEESMEFFNLLDTQIHHYLDQGTHDLFQRKLRDRALMEMPEFSWCSHWEDIHETMSCEKFKLWKQQNQELDEFLSKNGIECPSCKSQFELWKGGCLHFKCTQCQCEFCGACKQLFHQGQDCKFFEECQGKGLHAHHIRDCFYYLRDWSTERLQQLLQQNGIQYENDLSRHSVNSLQGILKENAQKKQDEDTAENTEDSGDNNIAEKELLVQLINANFLDPVDLYTEQEMKQELQRWKSSVPDHSRNDSEESYLEKLTMKIKQDIPLFVYPDENEA
ncbi:E3 ubiquitin-protein ligase RNF31-like isoform X2 [Rana temporaria]|uniref:E3 ubiquitin-protein ligase RNF31-like isoform X2 n=1 Tax=Rana temporaria TaxID=8407 RepID=UPI001AAD5B28|nr:E3 ubiquitin-protein ligase RNF31-like isoform X2 [Rana temporaria]